MNELIRIEDVEVQKICYRDQPVITLADIDRIHERPEGTAYRNFNENRDRFVYGSDFFDLPYEEWSVFEPTKSVEQERNSSDEKEVGGRRGNKIFMTMYGYLLLVKSLRDERAWRVQRLMADSYFDLKAIRKAALKDVEFLELQKKYIALLEKTMSIIETRKKKPFVPITDEERKQIADLHNQGVSYGEIARRTGRSRSGVTHIIKYGMQKETTAADCVDAISQKPL